MCSSRLLRAEWVNKICFLQQHQHSEKNQEILTLRRHIQILQQEHLSKISRIAELEAQLQSLKVQKG